MPTHGLLVAAAWLTGLSGLFKNGGEPTPPLTEAEGAALIARLAEASTRCRAYYELSVRAKPWVGENFATFQSMHPLIELLVCPQSGGQPPLYLVLEDWEVPSSNRALYAYPLENPFELFKDQGVDVRLRSWEGFGATVFDHQGRLLDPFQGDSQLGDPGIVADINGDGLLERVESANHFPKGIRNAQVLQISVVEKVARPILTVLYNWEEEDWSCRLTDADQDGVYDVVFGPKDGLEQAQTVLYRWNRDILAYEGPAGGEGSHVRRLAPKDVPGQLARLQNEGLTFSRDPGLSEFAKWQDGLWAKRGLKMPKPDEVSHPYRYQTLKSLSPEELMRYMGQGRSMAHLERDSVLKTRLPDGFWSMDAKAAALAMAQANRYPNHQRRFRLALDVRDGATPPEVGCLSFSHFSSPCFFLEDRQYFLRFDPSGSYLAFAQSMTGGSVDSNPLKSRSTYDLRRCALPFAEARQIAHCVWWLNRVRSLELGKSDGHSSTSSTADGRGILEFRMDAGGRPLRLQGTIWAAYAAERWTEEYTPEVCLNLVEFLLHDALPQLLNENWDVQKPRHSLVESPRRASAPENVEEDRIGLRKRIREFLDAFSLEQTHVSFDMLQTSALAAGEGCDQDLLPRLREILKVLPVQSQPKRSYEEVEAELETWDDSDEPLETLRQRMEARDKLEQERMSIMEERRTNAVIELRETIALSVRMLEAANNVDVLRDWACSSKRGAEWALRRLGELDKRVCVDAFVGWFEHNEDRGARHVFGELARVDPRLALEIAAKLSADKVTDPAFSALFKIDQIQDIPDKVIRVRALVDLLLATTSDWEAWRRVLNTLVPMDDPMRFPDATVDQTLFSFLEPEPGGDRHDFLVLGASEALARRGRTQAFDIIMEGFRAKQDTFVRHELLGPLAHLAQVDPAVLKSRLFKLVSPHLDRTDLRISEVIWSLWSADMRDGRQRLEQIATSGPDDHEDAKAGWSGGDVSPVNGRFHLARKIVSIWNEEDLPTRAKLLLALANTEEGTFDEPGAHPERRARFEIELKHLAGELTAEGRDEVSRFLQSIESPRDGHGAQIPKRLPTLLDELRKGLQL